MNILLYSHTFLPNIGGREIVVYYLAKSLMELGHDVRVVGPTGIRKQIRFTFPVHRYPRFIKCDLKTKGVMGLLRLKEMQLQLMVDKLIWGCDVIHAHTTYPAGYVASCAGRMFGKVPLVVTPHGIDINIIPDIQFGMRLKPHLKGKIDYALSEADAITAISDGIQDSIIDAGVDQGKLYKINNGVDLDRFAISTNDDVNKFLEIDHKSKVILTVGNYHPRKGHEDLINAMPDVLVNEPEAKLVIVGTGTDVLRDLINSLNLSNSIRLTGKINIPILEAATQGGSASFRSDMLSAIYQSCKVYVSASVTEGAEGLSLALLDAMAAGVPVIGTRITGNKDVIKHGHNGYLVAPSSKLELVSAITNILKNDEHRVKMGCNSQAIAADYQWSNIAKQYLKVYENVINKQ